MRNMFFLVAVCVVSACATTACATKDAPELNSDTTSVIVDTSGVTETPVDTVRTDGRFIAPNADSVK
jgi:hypothetical protein